MTTNMGRVPNSVRVRQDEDTGPAPSVDAVCGCLGGALVGLLAGWFVPAFFLVQYFHHLGKAGDQAGLLLFLTAPVGAIIGGVAGLRLRQWWGGGIGAILGLGPAAVGFVTENAMVAFLAPLACVLGGYLLQKAAAGWMKAPPPHQPETQIKSEPRPDDLIGEYEKYKEQHGPWVEDGRERQ